MKIFNYETKIKIAKAELYEQIIDRYITALYMINNETRKALSKIRSM